MPRLGLQRPRGRLFEKRHAKLGGRRKGTPSRVTRDIKELLASIVNEGEEYQEALRARMIAGKAPTWIRLPPTTRWGSPGSRSRLRPTRISRTSCYSIAGGCGTYLFSAGPRGGGWPRSLRSRLHQRKRSCQSASRKRTAPSAKISVGWSAGLPSTCSGAMHCSVPIMTPARVSDGWLMDSVRGNGTIHRRRRCDPGQAEVEEPHAGAGSRLLRRCRRRAAYRCSGAPTRSPRACRMAPCSRSPPSSAARASTG